MNETILECIKKDGQLSRILLLSEIIDKVGAIKSDSIEGIDMKIEVLEVLQDLLIKNS